MSEAQFKQLMEKLEEIEHWSKRIAQKLDADKGTEPTSIIADLARLFNK